MCISSSFLTYLIKNALARKILQIEFIRFGSVYKAYLHYRSVIRLYQKRKNVPT